MQQTNKSNILFTIGIRKQKVIYYIKYIDDRIKTLHIGYRFRMSEAKKERKVLLVLIKKKNI